MSLPSVGIKRVYLVGMPGSGKSSLGKKLAKELQWNYLDIDHCIESDSGISIPQIFHQFGEAAFRKIEQSCLHKTASINQTIIACGGGLPAFHGNMEWMLEHGLILFLDADPKLITDRILESKSIRPMFEGLGKDEIFNKVKKILAQRQPFYALAHKHIKIPIESTEPLINMITMAF